MERHAIENVPGLAPQRVGPHLSAAVRYGDLLFVSGQPPVNPDTGEFVSGPIDVQTYRVLDNLDLVLRAGGSSLDRVLKTSVLCTDSAHFSVVNRIYAEYFPEAPPARTFYPIGAFPYDFDIEIECVAAAGETAA